MLTTLTVDIGDPTANDPGDNLYAQIQEAVDAALPGDEIKVHAGTYNPFVVNTDNLTIREANANSNPVVDGDLNFGNENGVEVHASGVTIKGLAVQNTSGVRSDLFVGFRAGVGFLVTGDNNTLTGNTASNNIFIGFVLSFSDGNTLKGNTASDNDHGGFFIGGSIGGLSGGNNNTLKGNMANDNDGRGFRLDGNDNTLKGNTASGNGGDGFFLLFGDGNTLISNMANGNGSNGFQLSGGSLSGGGNNNTLKGNTASGNGGDGFLLFTGGNTLKGNTASDNGGSGFILGFGSDNNTLERNRAFLNDGYGILVDAVMANLFENNFCLFNGLGGSNQPGIC